jgi:hypothetical protein
MKVVLEISTELDEIPVLVNFVVIFSKDEGSWQNYWKINEIRNNEFKIDFDSLEIRLKTQVKRAIYDKIEEKARTLLE